MSGNIGSNKAPLTLQTGFNLPTRYSASRQFRAVLVKNFRLLGTTWCGIFWSAVAIIVILGLIIGLHYHYLSVYEDNSGSKGSNSTLYDDYEMYSLNDQAIVNTTYTSPANDKIFPHEKISMETTILIPFMTLVGLVEKFPLPSGSPLDKLDNYNIDQLKKDNVNIAITFQKIKELFKIDLSEILAIQGLGSISPTCISLDIPPMDIKAYETSSGKEESYDYGNSRSASFYGFLKEDNDPYYVMRNGGRIFKMYVYNETMVSKDSYESRKNHIKIIESVKSIGGYCKPGATCTISTLVGLLLPYYHTQQISFLIMTNYRRKTNFGETVNQQLIFKNFYASNVKNILGTPIDVESNFYVDPDQHTFTFKPVAGSFLIDEVIAIDEDKDTTKIMIDLSTVKTNNFFLRIKKGTFYLKETALSDFVKYEVQNENYIYGKAKESEQFQMESLPINTCNGYLGNLQNLPDYRKNVPYIEKTGPIHTSFLPTNCVGLVERSKPQDEDKAKRSCECHYEIQPEGQDTEKHIITPVNISLDDATAKYDFTELDEIAADVSNKKIYCNVNFSMHFTSLFYDTQTFTVDIKVKANEADYYRTSAYVDEVIDSKTNRTIASNLAVSSNYVYSLNNKEIKVDEGFMQITPTGFRMISGYYGFDDESINYKLNYPIPESDPNDTNEINVPDACCVADSIYLNYTNSSYNPLLDFDNIPKYHIRSSTNRDVTKQGKYDVPATEFYQIKKEVYEIAMVLKNETPVDCRDLADTEGKFTLDAKKKCIDRIQVSGTKFYTDYIEDPNYNNQRNARMYSHYVNYNEVAYGYDQNNVCVGQNVEIQTFMFNQTQILSKVKTFDRVFSMQQMLFKNMVDYSTKRLLEGVKDIWDQPVYNISPSLNLATQTYWENFGAMKPDEYTPKFCMFLIPFCFYILVSTFAYTHSNDRGEGLNNLHFMMGLKYKNKFFADFLYQLVIGMVFFILVIIMCYSGDLESVSKNTFLVTFFDFLLFVLNIPMLTIYIGCWFETGKASSLVSIIVVLIYCVGGILAGMSISGEDIYTKTLHWAYSFIPGFSPIAIFQEMCGVAILQDPQSYLEPSDIQLHNLDGLTNRFLIVRYSVGASITRHFITGYIMTAFWTLFAIYLDRIVPRRQGVPEHWLFPGQRMIRKLDIVKKYLAVKNYLNLGSSSFNYKAKHTADYSPITDDIDKEKTFSTIDGVNRIEEKNKMGEKENEEVVVIPIPYQEINEQTGLPFTETDLALRGDTYLYIKKTDMLAFQRIITKTDEEIEKEHNYAILSLYNFFAALWCFICHPKLMTMKMSYDNTFGVFLAIHHHQRSAVPESDEKNVNLLKEDAIATKSEQNENMIDLESEEATKELLYGEFFRSSLNDPAPIPFADVVNSNYDYAVPPEKFALNRRQIQQVFSEYSQSTSEYVGKNGVNASGRRSNRVKNVDPLGGFNSKDEDVTNERENTIRNCLASNGGRPLVRVLDIKKTYRGSRTTPPKDAVRGIYLTVGENECLGLLGSNGAGKTTLLNMLCMSFKPTSGTAFIDGYDITNPSTRSLIQASLGVCPQFDIHWPTLTCADHLRFFCRIKGVPTEYEAQHVNDLLQAVGLSQQASVPSKSLSGGMRRRLSVAMSLCGKPKVLLLDEPSTGLDPENRRGLWNIIIACRPGRATIITSHAMEEVVALCTRATINADGKLRCIGTIPHLQNKFGTGYQLGVHIALNSSDNLAGAAADVEAENVKIQPVHPITVGSIVLTQKLEQDVHQIITSRINGVKLMSAYYGALVYSIPDSARISDIFPIMETLVSDKTSAVCDWSIAQTSLENIFLRIVNESRVE